MKKDRPRTSRQRYLRFVEDYKARRLDTEEEEKKTEDAEKPGDGAQKPEDRKAKRREHLRAYCRWLRPHRYAVAVVFFYALIAAALEMVEPLFMRFIIDHALLDTTADAATRARRLQTAGLV